jgi:nicotinamidase-related amidase
MITAIDKNTALVVIDLQDGIVKMKLAHPAAEVVGQSAKLVDAFRAAMEAAGFFELVPELGAKPDDIYVTKKTWNAFYDTSLEERLRELGVTHIVLCGIATSIGVEGTARAAYERGFNLSFASDAMTDLLEGAHEHSLTVIFPRIGEVDKTDTIIGHLQKR